MEHRTENKYDKLQSIILLIFNIQEPAPSSDPKTKAVDEMMERIKKGIMLRPMKRVQVSSIFYLSLRQSKDDV